MNAIVITSIFEPTEAIKKFSNIRENHKLFVVGDKKTPSNWFQDNTIFLPVDSQETNNFKISKELPYNHYCRKMLGYLYAMKNGATAIIDTDDDNIPKEGWSFPPFSGSFDYIDKGLGFVNIYKYFTNQHIWPRGLPLNRINDKSPLKAINNTQVKIGIWQGLADEDPDVDAIYRMTSDEVCYFDDKEPVVLGKGTITPFNTQNTIICKELYSLMYLPTSVTFRFTDILRGLIAQPIMWSKDYLLGFVNATVTQKRNPHDYFKDFVSEVPMYLNCDELVQFVSDAILPGESINNNLFKAYEALHFRKIVTDKELVTLEAWLRDIESLGL